MSSTLTQGFCELVHGDSDASDVQPILQVLSVKKINAQNASGQDRYRIILSDGKYFIQAMLATQLNDYVSDRQLDKNVLIKLTEYVTNAVQGRKLVIILKIEIVPYTGDKIGNPANLEQSLAADKTTAPAAAAPAARAPAAAGAGAAGRGGQAGGARHGRQPNRSTSGKDMGPLYPIEGLSPYQNKWTIKARVSQRSDIKHWSNNKGDGKLFSVTLMDESGEIRATGFNEQCDMFYEMMQEGKVFFVSRARINIAKKQFNNVNNEYEIMLTNDTEIEPCDDESVPKVKYNFCTIGDLANLEKDQLCDVVAIVKEIHELGSVTSKATQKPFAKRDIQLVDASGQSVRLTLWGKQAESFDHQDEPIIAFKGVKVGDFGGRSLSMFSNATMAVEPDIPEAHQLRGWYDAEGKNKEFTAYSNTSATRTDSTNNTVKPSELKTLGQAKDEQLGMSDKTDYFTSSATIVFIKQETFAYPACANPDGCNKKVQDVGDEWLCEKCDKRWPTPIYRYILQINLMDHAGSIWITAFNEVAENLMGISANDLQKLKDGGEESKANGYFQAAIGKSFTFSMMAKQDSYNDQPRVRYQCRKANTPDYPSDSAHLAQLISAY